MNNTDIGNLFNLRSKKAIITGVTGSIGFACAQALSAYGATIVLVGRNHEKLNASKEKLIEQFDNESKLSCECINFDDQKAMQLLFQNHSDANILVNSVGINIPQSLLDVTEENYDTIVDSNLKTAFFQTQSFVKARLSNNANKESSTIIHISSQMGFVGGDKRSVYCASKHALQGMCKAISLEIGQWNMRINTISPTFIENEFAKQTLADPAMKKLITESIVFNRIGQADDLYGAVVFLASDASKLITGTSITVDGGWTAR